MAGLYIHIPFCSTKCSYCDFYSITNTSQQDEYIKCLIKEIGLQKEYLSHQYIETIYFGGGTPSMLSQQQLLLIFNAINSNFKVANNAEITLEANPDDLTIDVLTNISNSPVNRLSIGIQSFHEKELDFLNRRHNAQQAIDAVKNAQKVGFNNISIDLIYGIPNSTVQSFQESLNVVNELGVQHLSAYHLIYEEGTPLYKRLKENKVSPVKDTVSVEQYILLTLFTKELGFEHYEISNFCKPNLESKHNSSYWQQRAYLGLGPSAHSYNTFSRQWNVRSLSKYLAAVNNGEISFEKEDLIKQDRFNEYLMTTLRTSRGSNVDYIQKEFGIDYLNHLLNEIANYSDAIEKTATHIKISPKYWFVSDNILSSLFVG